MNQVVNSSRDRAAWDAIFAHIPVEWYTAPASRAMVECTDFLLAAGARSVLDLGCAIGRWSVHLARAGMQVSGVDFSPNAVRHARRWSEAERLDIRFACGSVTDEAFPGERFDAVVAALVLDNMTRAAMRDATARMRTSLRPGGVAFCLFNPVAMCADSADEDNPTAGLTHIVYTDHELTSAFTGFDVLRRGVYEAGTRGLYLRRRSQTPTPEASP